MGTIIYKCPTYEMSDMLISAQGGSITQLYFAGGRTTPLGLQASHPTPEEAEVLTHATRELDMYFAGKLETFTMPVAPQGTPFRQLAWKGLQGIPYGQAISYKELAARIGNPKAIRAVGGANNKNPISIIIPCHRVVGANGSLVGYGGGLDVKEILLRHEGVLL